MSTNPPKELPPTQQAAIDKFLEFVADECVGISYGEPYLEYTKAEKALLACIEAAATQRAIEELEQWNAYGHPNIHQSNDLMNRIDMLRAQLGGGKS